jgi:hypothetical protein
MTNNTSRSGTTCPHKLLIAAAADKQAALKKLRRSPDYSLQYRRLKESFMEGRKVMPASSKT